MNAHEKACYVRRNAAVALVKSLLDAAVVASVPEMGLSARYSKAVEKAKARAGHAVETTPWMSGFYINCGDISRREEKAVLADVAKLMPNVRVTIARASKSSGRSNPRHIRIAL